MKWARAAPGSVERGAVVFEQRRGGAREAGTAGIGLGVIVLTGAGS